MLKVIIATMLSILFVSGPAGAADPLMNSWSESYRLEASGQYIAALEHMERILKKTPNEEFAIMRRAWLNYLQGNHNKAIADYKQALKINHSSLESYLGLTLPLMAQNRWREAARYANQVLKSAPWNYYAHIRLMRCQEAQQQWERLAAHALAVFKRYPSDATTIVYLARANRQLGRKAEARRYYQAVLQRVPGHVEATNYLTSGQ